MIGMNGMNVILRMHHHRLPCHPHVLLCLAGGDSPSQLVQEGQCASRTRRQLGPFVAARRGERTRMTTDRLACLLERSEASVYLRERRKKKKLKKKEKKSG